MLRAAVESRSDLGIRAQAVMERGELVSDELIIALVRERIADPDCRSGFIFDGFPRTLVQAQSLISANIDIDLVLHISVSADEIVRRLSGRRIDPVSGRVYHLDNNPPPLNADGTPVGELIQRKDDDEETVRHRIETYQKQTRPLIDFYSIQAKDKALDYQEVAGTGSVKNVQDRLFDAVQRFLG